MHLWFTLLKLWYTFSFQELDQISFYVFEALNPKKISSRRLCLTKNAKGFAKNFSRFSCKAFQYHFNAWILFTNVEKVADNYDG